MKKLFTLLLLSCSIAIAHAQVPDFSFTDTEGVTHKLSDALANDRVILLDFFFVDCPQCITTRPEIEKIAEEFEDKTLELWAISDRDSDAYINQSDFKPVFSNHFVGGVDGNGLEVVNLFADEFEFEGFPTYSVICKDESITWDIWPLSDGAEEIRELLTEECGVVDLDASGIPMIEALNDLAVVPNPANDFTNVEFVLSEATDLRIDLRNNLGQVIQTISNQTYQAGIQQLPLETAALANGIYILSMQSAQGVQSTSIQVVH